MAIITAIRELTFEETASDPKTEYELSYLIKVASTSVRLAEVRTSREVVDGLHVPIIGLPATFDPTVVCSDRKFKWTEDPLWCIGTFKFERDPQKGDPEEAEEENPLARPVKKSWRTNKVNKPITEDIDGNKILNTAGMPYIDAVEKRTSHLVLTVNRVEASFNGTRAYGLIDRTNSDTISGAAPGTLLLDIAADNFYAIGREFWDVTYSLEYDPDGWNPKVLEQGVMERDFANDSHTKILDPKTQLPVSDPVPLSAVGLSLWGSSLPDLAVTTTWTIYETMHYANELKLPL